jgi:hypothetical protein
VRVRRITLFIVCGVVLIVQVVLAESTEQSRTRATSSLNELRNAAVNDSPVVSFIPRPKALTSQDPKKFSPLDKAYLDAFSILTEENSCSRFFGGPSAIEALTEFVQQLKPTYLDRGIAIRMSGPTTVFVNARTGFSFRLFQKAEINLGGPFYRSNGLLERHVALTGKYEANTRESRLIVLLHELGHLVKGTDRQWLLEDDGQDRTQSVRNSERVTEICQQEINLARRKSFAELYERSQWTEQIAVTPREIPSFPLVPRPTYKKM